MTVAGDRRPAPGPRQALPLPYGLIPAMRRDPIRFYSDAVQRYGDVVRFQVGSANWHALRHPDHLKHVLHDHYKNYPRSWAYDIIALMVGRGLVTTEGETWLRQRRLIQPLFNRQRLTMFAGIMTDAAAATVKRWQPHAGSGRPLDVAQEMLRLTLAIVGRALFSTDLGDEADVLSPPLTVAMDYINHRLNHLFSPPLAVPTPRNLRFRRAMAALDRVVYGIIAARRRDGGPSDDLVSALLAARDEDTGAPMSDRQIRDELITFLLAGHETTAVALGWTWYLLSRHPEVDRRLRTELAAVFGGRPPTVEDVPRLAYTRRVIEEAMRLYPPVWAVSRIAATDDVIGGYHIPAKSLILVSPYLVHRHPEFWENPEGFDPERFTPERSAGRPRYAYIPFLAGPHQCIGNEFALLEAQLIVATVAQAYRLHLLPGFPVEPHAIFTLRPRHGLQMTVHPAGPATR